MADGGKLYPDCVLARALRLTLAWSAMSVMACSTVDKTPHWTDGGDETGGPLYGDEPPIAPRGPVPRKNEYDANHSPIAVGNVARALDDPGFCSG